MLLIKKYLRSKTSVIILVMIAYVAFVFYADFGNLTKASMSIDIYSIPLIIGPMVLAILLLGFRFHRYLRILNIDISLVRSITIYIAGLSFLATPATSGQVIKSDIIKNQFGSEISRTAPIILVEKWNELNCAVIFLVLLVLFQYMLESALIILIAGAISIVLFASMANKVTFNLFKKIAIRFSFLRKYEESLEKSQEALQKITSKKMVAEASVITLPSIVLQSVSVYFCFQALDIQVDFISSSQIFYVSLISGVLALIPGGLGVTEGSMLALLVKYSGEDVLLLSAAVLFVRLITLWFPTALGLITYRFVTKRNQSSRSD